jgi:2-keto-4-pentenoate hydratase
MGKLSFIAGLAAGYVLGARAGRQRYEQIRRTSSKVWQSGPVQKQVDNAKEVAKTKAAPVVADMVADAARSTGEKLRQGKTVASEAISSGGGDGPPDPGSSGAASSGASSGATVQDHTDAWSATTRPTSGNE